MELYKLKPYVMGTDFGDWLFEELRRQGMSQSELSRQSGLTHVCITQIIHGKNRPNLTTVEKIVRVLGEGKRGVIGAV